MKKDEHARHSDAALYDARKRVIDAMPGIIDAIIEKAEDEASYQHAKFLLEFASSNPSGEADPASEESLAAMLLKELRDEPVA